MKQLKQLSRSKNTYVASDPIARLECQTLRKHLILLAASLMFGIAPVGAQTLAYQWIPLDGEQMDSSPALDKNLAVADGGMVYIATHAHLYQFQADGEGINVFPLQTGQSWETDGQSSSPALDLAGNIYLGTSTSSGGSLMKFYCGNGNVNSGSTLWTYTIPDGGMVYSTPTIGSDGFTAYVGTDDGGSPGVYGINTGGAQIWFYPFDHVDSSLAISSSGTLYCQTEHDNLLFALTNILSPSASSKWFAPVQNDLYYYIYPHFTSSPAVDSDGTVYIGSEIGLCAIKTDGNVRWVFVPHKNDLSGYPQNRFFQSSPVIGLNGAIYIGGHDGMLYAITNSTSGVGQKWSWFPSPTTGPNWGGSPTLQPILATPAIAQDGTIYVTLPDPVNGSTWLFAVKDTPTGPQQSWALNLLVAAHPGVYTPSSPLIAPNGQIFVSDSISLYSVTVSTHSPLANSPWPMYHHDAKHRGYQGYGVY